LWRNAAALEDSASTLSMFAQFFGKTARFSATRFFEVWPVRKQATSNFADRWNHKDGKRVNKKFKDRLKFF
jgi:hypothetical protein